MFKSEKLFLILALSIALIVAVGPLSTSGPPTAWAASQGWTQLAPAASPAARSSASMTYDASSGTVILFGGTIAGPCCLNDTWSWNGSAWTQLLANGASGSPSARYEASMAYDATTSTVLLFGGCCDATGSYNNDTWGWTGSAWSQLVSPGCTNACPNSPALRLGASMAYDAATNTVLLFGGGDDSGLLDDTWSWDGSTWTQLTPATSPTARYGPSMAYDAATGTVLLFSGENGGTVYNDTWSWGGSTWTQLVPTTSPPARYSASMVYDQAAGAIVLFGGVSTTSVFSPLSDTWSWNGMTWSQLSPPTQPPARKEGSMAYNEATTTVLLFGGYGNGALGDTWSWSAILAKGDVNGDGQVTSLDALCVLRIVAALTSTDNCPIPPPGDPIIAIGEANGPTSVDALCILRGVVGLPATSTCPLIVAPTARPGS